MKNIILLLLVIAFTNVKGQYYEVNVSTIGYFKNGKPAGQIFDGIVKAGDSISITYDVNRNITPADTSVLINFQIVSSDELYRNILYSASWNTLNKAINNRVIAIVPPNVPMRQYSNGSYMNQCYILITNKSMLSISVRPVLTATETPTTAPDKEFTFYSILGTNKTTCKFTDLPSGLWVCDRVKYLK